MSDTTKLTYAALVTISLPGKGTTARANVMLTPADEIPANGRMKALRDCTLADLLDFAETLEADVWEAYQAVRLLDVDENEQVEVQVTLADETKPVENWLEQAIIWPAEAPQTPAVEEASAPAPAAPEPAAEESVAAEPAPVRADTVTEPETAVADEETEQPVAESTEEETAAPDVTEADVRLGETLEAPEPAAAVPTSDTVIRPSKARVRVAGRQLPAGHPTWAAVDILMDEPALRQAQAHALSSLKREVAGVMVGPRPEKQPDGRYLVHVIDTIEAKHTVMHGASVTYTPESWRYLNDTLSERYPEETAVMVGWYHTHPGFGIFLSGMDLFIHQNFFTQIWHVAYVLDPVARTSGFFCWDRPKERVSRYDFAWPSWAAGSW